YDNTENTELTTSGILRIKDSSSMNLLAPGIAYSDTLSTNMIAKNKTSDIVKAQVASNTNVMTNETLDASANENLLSYLVANEIPSSIM
ncbi:sulfate ABC transporter ATP-binding protein, partial [Enterococcus faecalis]